MDFLSGKIEKILIGIFLLSLFIGSYRIIGYFVYDIPYGYDPGFFRYAIQVSIDALPSISAPTSPYLPYNEPLYGILTTVLTFIGYSSDTIIGPFLGFLSIFTAFCIYFFAKQSYNRSVGLVAASIFLLSIVQFEEYWWNYWRNILGIIFLIISLGFLLRKSPLAILTIAGLFTIHRPSALYFAVVALLAIIASGIQQKKCLGNKDAYSYYDEYWHFLCTSINSDFLQIGSNRLQQHLVVLPSQEHFCNLGNFLYGFFHIFGSLFLLYSERLRKKNLIGFL
ncbi:hypothetical protein HOO68_05715 [Candidatus Gracilibacteria bacterium]|nr:hypothetical protein [Candidatus Gracilibacteria bacterium]